MFTYLLDELLLRDPASSSLKKCDEAMFGLHSTCFKKLHSTCFGIIRPVRRTLPLIG